MSLASYDRFEVAPVVDASGYTMFPYPIADSLRVRLVKQIKDHGLTVGTPEADSGHTAGVLVLKGTLTAFRPGGPYLREPVTRIYSRCSFVTDLIDKETGRQVGHIVSEEDSNDMPFQVLMTCAREVGDEVARQKKSG